MMTGLSGPFPVGLGHDLHLELGRTRAIVVALLATLCIAFLSTAATRLARSAPTAAARPVPGSPARLPEIAPASSALGGLHRPRVEIEAIADSLAKRYRISAAALRGVVATAYREGQRTGLDPLLIIAVIAVESGFNPIAESEMGAQGLMQVIPRYHPAYVEAAGADSVLDPHSNIRLGARVLSDYIRAGGTEVAGLQRYNGATGDPSNAYAAKVLGEKQRLQRAIQRARDRLPA